MAEKMPDDNDGSKVSGQVQEVKSSSCISGTYIKNKFSDIFGRRSKSVDQEVREEKPDTILVEGHAVDDKLTGENKKTAREECKAAEVPKEDNFEEHGDITEKIQNLNANVETDEQRFSSEQPNLAQKRKMSDNNHSLGKENRPQDRQQETKGTDTEKGNEELQTVDMELAADRKQMQDLKSEAEKGMRRLADLQRDQMPGQNVAAAMQNAMKQNYERGLQDAMSYIRNEIKMIKTNGLVVMYDENESSRVVAGMVGDSFRKIDFVVPAAVSIDDELTPPQQCRLEWLVMYVVVEKESSLKNSVQKLREYINDPIFCDCSKLLIVQILQQEEYNHEYLLNWAEPITIVTTDPKYHHKIEKMVNETDRSSFKNIVDHLKSDEEQPRNENSVTESCQNC